MTTATIALITALNDARLDAHSANYRSLLDTLVPRLAAAGYAYDAEELDRAAISATAFRAAVTTLAARLYREARA